MSFIYFKSLLQKPAGTQQNHQSHNSFPSARVISSLALGIITFTGMLAAVHFGLHASLASSLAPSLIVGAGSVAAAAIMGGKEKKPIVTESFAATMRESVMTRLGLTEKDRSGKPTCNPNGSTTQRFYKRGQTFVLTITESPVYSGL